MSKIDLENSTDYVPIRYYLNHHILLLLLLLLLLFSSSSFESEFELFLSCVIHLVHTNHGHHEGCKTPPAPAEAGTICAALVLVVAPNCIGMHQTLTVRREEELRYRKLTIDMLIIIYDLPSTS